MVRYSVRAFRQKVYRSWRYYQKTFPSKTVGSALNYPSRKFFLYPFSCLRVVYHCCQFFFSFFMIVFNNAGSGTKRKVQTQGSLWGSRQGTGLEVGNEADKIDIFCRETKKISSNEDGVTTMHENLRPLCVVDPLVGSARCLLLLCSPLLGL